MTSRSPFSAAFTAESADQLAGVLKAIAQPHRLRILALLLDGPLSVTEIQSGLGDLSQPTTSHHLRILDAAGITEARKIGVNVYRALNAERLRQLSELLNPRGRQ